MIVFRDAEGSRCSVKAYKFCGGRLRCKRDECVNSNAKEPKRKTKKWKYCRNVTCQGRWGCLVVVPDSRVQVVSARCPPSRCVMWRVTGTPTRVWRSVRGWTSHTSSHVSHSRSSSDSSDVLHSGQSTSFKIIFWFCLFIEIYLTGFRIRNKSGTASEGVHQENEVAQCFFSFQPFFFFWSVFFKIIPITVNCSK